MKYFNLKICGLERKLPIVSLGPKLKVASFNLLGDGELTRRAALEIYKGVRSYNVDCFVGPEVKVVPLLQELSTLSKKDRYVVSRKKIHGYMVNPIQLSQKPTLVLDGSDVSYLKGKRVLIVDDVISTGRSLETLTRLVRQSGAEIIAYAVILKQGNFNLPAIEPLVFIGELPVFSA